MLFVDMAAQDQRDQSSLVSAINTLTIVVPLTLTISTAKSASQASQHNPVSSPGTSHLTGQKSSCHSNACRPTLSL